MAPPPSPIPSVLRRLAAWYGTDGWGLAARGLAVGGLAAFMAAWLLVDHGSGGRAALAAAGVGVAALSPLAMRNARPRALGLLLSVAALSVGVGLDAFALTGDPGLSAWIGVGLALTYRVRMWSFDASVRSARPRRR